MTRSQYEQMVSDGVFPPAARLELLEGGIVAMTPQSSRHATAVQLVQRALERLYGDGFTVRVQMPLALDADSEPEPDVAVVPGEPRNHRDAHPTHAVLVVEVADASLAYDRERKAALYARCAIPEYWIVNMVDRLVEVHKGPADGSYRSTTLHRDREVVKDSIRADDLLP